MPQMSPINWFIMFMLFMLLYNVTMNKVYFNRPELVNYPLNLVKGFKNFKPLYWKW